MVMVDTYGPQFRYFHRPQNQLKLFPRNTTFYLDDDESYKGKWFWYLANVYRHPLNVEELDSSDYSYRISGNLLSFTYMLLVKIREFEMDNIWSKSAIDTPEEERCMFFLYSRTVEIYKLINRA